MHAGPHGSVVEHFLGKEEVTGSIPVVGSMSRIRPVAQLAERRSPKPQVGGSIPSWPAKNLSAQSIFDAEGCC